MGPCRTCVFVFCAAVWGTAAGDTSASGPRWPFGILTTGQTVTLKCGRTITGYIPFKFATACDHTTETLDGASYSLVTGLQVPTRGQSQKTGKSFPRNGNLIDLANASHFEQSPYVNNRLNTNNTGTVNKAFPFWYDENSLYTAEKPGANSERCVDDTVDMELFRYLPFWASEEFEVQFCVYRYDPDASASQRYSAEFKKVPNGNDIDRGYYDNVSIAQHTFSSDMNMEPPLTCSSDNNMCLPGRCGMLDTNYLFRLSDRTDTVFQLKYDFNGTAITNAYIAVYGKAQCDPMYGGGLVNHKKDATVIRYPPSGDFDSESWHRYADGYDAYTTDAMDNLFTETGTVLALPTYAFVSWEDIDRLNPNPKWWYRSKAEWHDGDPVGIRRYDRLGFYESQMPNCSDFGAFVPLSDAARSTGSDAPFDDETIALLSSNTTGSGLSEDQLKSVAAKFGNPPNPGAHPSDVRAPAQSVRQN